MALALRELMNVEEKKYENKKRDYCLKICLKSANVSYHSYSQTIIPHFILCLGLLKLLIPQFLKI